MKKTNIDENWPNLHQRNDGENRSYYSLFDDLFSEKKKIKGTFIFKADLITDIEDAEIIVTDDGHKDILVGVKAKANNDLYGGYYHINKSASVEEFLTAIKTEFSNIKKMIGN